MEGIITSKVDYCNSILFGLSSSQLQKLHCVQNATARIKIRTGKHDQITPILRELHWLLVKERINFKILLLTFKAYSNITPAYLNDMLKLQTNERCKLRSEECVASKAPKQTLHHVKTKNFLQQLLDCRTNHQLEDVRASGLSKQIQNASFCYYFDI